MEADDVVKLLLSSGEEKLRLSDLCNGPIAVSADNSDGSVWIVCHHTHETVKISEKGEEQVRVTGFSYPRSVDVNENTGEVWIADWNSHSVVKLLPDVPDGYDVGICTGHHIRISGFNYPNDVSVNQDNGVVWTADSGSGKIYSLSAVIPDGYDVSGDAGNHRVKSGFNNPLAVSVNNSDGTCWVADSGNDRIVKLSPSGTTEILRRGGFNFPHDVSVNPADGSCWAADTSNNRIVRLSSSGSFLSEITEMNNPYSVSVDPRDGSCWVADYGHHEVVKIIVAGVEVLRSSGFYYPTSVEVYSSVPPTGAPSAAAQVYPIQVQTGETVNFHGTGTDSDGIIILYEWDFDGDGIYDWTSESTGITAFAYAESGIFNPAFRVTDDNYSTDEDYSQIVRVGILAAFADAVPAEGNAPLSVTFSGSFFDPVDGHIESYQWDFDGDGFYDFYQPAVQNTMTVDHVFSRYGIYDATLKITDTGNITATDTVTVEVLKSAPDATAQANPTGGPAPLLVELIGDGSDPDGIIVLYEWDFEDDGEYDWTSTTSEPLLHLYAEPGDYTARFRVTDNDGQTAEDALEIDAHGDAPSAFAEAAPVQGHAPLTVNFSGSGTDPDGYIELFQWDFDGDGEYDWSGQASGDVQHQYDQAGQYYAALTVTDNDDEQDTAYLFISVFPANYPVAVAQAEPEVTYINEEIALIGENSYDPDGTIELYEWSSDAPPAFREDCESGNSQWNLGSDWELTDQVYHSPAHCLRINSQKGQAENGKGADVLQMLSSLFAARSAYPPTAPANKAESLSFALNTGIAELMFFHRYSFTGDDSGHVDVSTDGGAHWTELIELTGTKTSWSKEEIMISEYTGYSATRIRFVFESGEPEINSLWNIDDITVLNLEWEYSSSIYPNTTTAYAEEGTYTAVLRVTDDDDNKNMDTTEITVELGAPQAVADALPDSGAVPLAVNLMGEDSYDPNGTIELYEWDYGNYSAFNDDYESGVSQWTLDENWELTTETFHSPVNCLKASSGARAGIKSKIMEVLYSSGDFLPKASALPPSGTSITAVSPLFETSPGPGKLRFYHKYTMENSVSGHIDISTNGGTDWHELMNISGNQSSWISAEIDISAYTGASDTCIRFRFIYEEPPAGEAWFIDDVTIRSSNWSHLSPNEPDAQAYYEEVGVYTAILRVTDDDGITDMDTICIEVDFGLPVAVAEASPQQGLTPLNVNLIGEYSYDPNGTIELYEWDYGTSQAFFDDFESGTYQWTLDAPWGLNTEICRSPTHSLFSYSENTHQKRNLASVIFDPLSATCSAPPPTGTSASATSMAFNLPAGPASLKFFNQRILADGDSCQVDISTDNGASWTELAYYSENCDYWILEQIDVTGYSGCSETKISFKYVTFDFHAGYGWRLDDVSLTSTGWGYSSPDQPNTSTIYEQPGIFHAALRVTDDEGYSSTDNVLVKAQSMPAAEIYSPMPEDVLKRNENLFYGEGTDIDGTIALYEWDFNGDSEYDWNSTETGATIHNITDEGSWTAYFRVTDNEGLTYTTFVEYSVELFPPVIASFSAEPEEGNVPLWVNFDVQAYDTDGNITQYQWDWDGNGTYDETTQHNDPSHFYMIPDIYEPRVKTIDDDFLEAEEIVTIRLKPVGYPNASAQAVPAYGYVGQILDFLGSGTDDGAIALYEWDFDGNGSYEWTSTISGVTTHAYEENGIFQAVLRVTDDDGYQDTDTTILYIDYASYGAESVWVTNKYGEKYSHKTNPKNCSPLFEHTVRTKKTAAPPTGTDTGKVDRYSGGVWQWETGDFNDPRGISCDPVDESVWVADCMNNQVVKLGASGNEVFRLDGFEEPWDTGVFHADGSCWVTDRQHNQVVLLDSQGQELQRVDGFDNPLWLDVDQSDGSVWVADHGANAVVKLAVDGTETARLNTFLHPVGIAVNQSDGACWAADRDNDSLVLIAADGSSELMRIPGFECPHAVAADPDNGAWVSDLDKNSIYHISNDGTFISETEFGDAYGLVQDMSSLNVWAVDHSNHSLSKLSSGGNILMNFPEIFYPWDLDLLPGFTQADEPPLAFASADPLAGDSPLNVSFSGTGTDNGYITTYQWDFNADGVWDFTSSVNGAADHTYDTPGIYNPVFRVTDDQGLHGFVSSILIRTGPIQIWSEASPATGNAPLTVTFDGGGSTPYGDGRIHSFQWDFEGDGIFDWTSESGAHVNHDFLSGNYTPVLELTDSESNKAFSIPATITVSKSLPASSLWVSPSSGQNPLMTAMHGNHSSDPDGFIVFWEYDYDGDGTFDYGSETDSGVEYTYTGVGDYNLTLRVTDNDNLNDTTSTEITVVNSPPEAHANAAPQVGNAPLEVTFNGVGIDFEAPVALYEWDFGDQFVFYDDFESGVDQWILESTWGLTETECHSPSHSLTNFVDKYEEEKSQSLFEPKMFDKLKPESSAPPPTGTVTTVESTSFEIPAGTAMLKFISKYNFQSGIHGSASISTNGGTDWIQLETYQGMQASWTASVIDISVYSGQSETRIRFSLSSFSPVMEQVWHIDDVCVIGITWAYASAENGDTQHTYLSPNHYTAMLRVTDEDGLTDTDTANIEVRPCGAPTALAYAHPVKGGIPLTVEFEGTGHDPDGEIILYQWDFDGNGDWDCSSSETGAAAHTYSDGGVYEAFFQITDDDLLKDDDSVLISVGMPVALPLTYPRSGPAPLTVQFVCNGHDPDGTIEYFYWDFDGDGIDDYSSPITSAINYEYEDCDIYEARLTVLDNDGLSDSAIIEIEAYTQSDSAPSAYADASVFTGPPPLNVFFTGYGSDFDGTIELFEWDFNGDGQYDWNSSFQGDVLHTYENAGDYHAVFQVTDNDLLSGTAALWINVNPPGSPTALADADPKTGIAPLTVTFMGEGTDTDGNIELFEWDFLGDGTYDWSSTETGSVFFIFTEPGTYEPTLRVTDDDDLTDTDRILLDVDLGLTAHRSTEIFDPTVGQTMTIESSLSGTSTITMKIINRKGEHIRTLVDDESRTPGYYSDVWNGKNDNENFVASGVYFFIIEYTVGGKTYRLDTTGSAGQQIFPTVTYSSAYNPLEDDYLTATFTLDTPAEITTYVSPYSGGTGERIKTIHTRKPFRSGPRVITWDGTADNGAVAPFDSSYVMAVLMWALSDNAVIAACDPVIDDVSVEPNFFTPQNPNQLEPSTPCKFTYTLSKSSDIIVSVRDQNNLLVNEYMLTGISQGEKTFYWDGKGYNDRLMIDGMYCIGFRAEDPFGNVSEKVHAIMKVFY